MTSTRPTPVQGEGAGQGTGRDCKAGKVGNGLNDYMESDEFDLWTWLDAIHRSPHFTPATKDAAYALATWCRGGARICWPSLPQIWGRMGKDPERHSERVTALLDPLVERGWLERDKRGSGRRATFVYGLRQPSTRRRVLDDLPLYEEHRGTFYRTDFGIPPTFGGYTGTRDTLRHLSDVGKPPTIGGLSSKSSTTLRACEEPDSLRSSSQPPVQSAEASLPGSWGQLSAETPTTEDAGPTQPDPSVPQRRSSGLVTGQGSHVESPTDAAVIDIRRAKGAR